MATQRYRDPEALKLAREVRLLQKRGLAADASGRGWAAWLAAQDDSLVRAADRTLLDPAKHSAATLRCFLDAVPQEARQTDPEAKELADQVKARQKRRATDSAGRGWAEWLDAQGDLAEDQRRVKDPAHHTAATLRRFLAAATGEAKPPKTQDQGELRELASAVRAAQRRGVVDGTGKGWLEWLAAHGSQLPAKLRETRDPSRHRAETLRSFLAALPPGECDALEHRMRRDQQSRRALGNLREVYAAADEATAAEASRLFALIEHTRGHAKYPDHYGGLPTHQEGWMDLPQRPKGEVQEHTLFPPDVRSLLLAIDCEMVATKSDSSALARVCVSNSDGRVLLDRLVRPEEEATDLRSHITGIQPGDLQATQYTRADAQRDVLALCSPSTVLVGHTLHKDMDALKLDAPLVVDIAFLYGLEGQPSKMPPLAHLVEQVLGRTGFRGADGQAAHDCADDVMVSMDLLLHRLQLAAAGTVVPSVVQVAPPASTPQLAGQAQRAGPGPVDEACTLLAHRVPDRAGAFAALAALFVSLGDCPAPEGVELLERKGAAAAQNLRSALIIFTDRDAAQAAFAALALAPASGARPSRVTSDRDGRPQKEVEMWFPDGEAARVYVRTGVVPAAAPSPTGASAASAAGAPVPGATPGAATSAASGAAAAPAAEVGDSPPGGKKRPWTGWRAAVEEELAAAPGRALPWKRLRTAVVARARAVSADGAHGALGIAGGGEEEFGMRALACIPEAFLSTKDAMVRLPDEA